MRSDSDLLDLKVGQRASHFEFDVLDKALNRIGSIKPNYSQPMTLSNDTTRTIKRTLTNFTMAPGTWEDMNLLTDRIAPRMVLENGSAYPLGVFLFGDGSRSRATYGKTLQASLVDQGLMLDQGVEHTTAVPPYSTITEAINLLLDDSPLIAFIVDDISTLTGSEWLVWPVGTSRMKILTDLTQLGSLYAPYFTNDGYCRCRVVPDLATATPAVTYRAGLNIFANTIVESDDALSAPNRYVVVDSGATTTPVFGSWDIPDDAPHSIAKRGFAVVRVEQMQNLGTTDAAVAAAKALGQQDKSALTHVSFAGPPDPRHDSFDVIDYRIGDPAMDGKYRETAWSMQLLEGADMTHTLLRIYGVV